MKPGMVDYVRDPTPHENFGGGSTTWVVWANVWLVKSLSFFSFSSFFSLSSSRAQVAFLDRSEQSVRHNACFRPRMCLLGGSRQYPTTFRGSNPQKTSPKWAGIGTSQPNRQSSKNSHISVTDEDICVIFHTEIQYRGHSRKKCKIWSNGVMKGSRDLLLKFWDPLHISETVEARNLKFGMHIDYQGH